MEYTVKFHFNCIGKNGTISGKTGEADITTSESPEALKSNPELLALIAQDMKRKTGKGILSVDVTDIIPK